jgi:hypothetical protein
LTGSGINYAKSPSGYHNTVLPELYKAETVKDMAKIVREHKGTKYTSVGYQFPAFPKPVAPFTKGGDYFICIMVPKLIQKFVPWLTKAPTKNFREIGDWLFKWNAGNGLRAYKFQYAAVIADIADFYPHLVNLHSPFYYGTNAVECIKYMAVPKKRMRELDFLDAVMEMAVHDTGHSAYNVEDQMCDCIRWIENYIRPGGDYDHLDLDKVWSSSRILHHPKGRQKKMLDLGLIDTFNGLGKHPSDYYVLEKAGVSPIEYAMMVESS